MTDKGKPGLPMPNVFDDEERDWERAQQAPLQKSKSGGKLPVAVSHAAGFDEKCYVCADPARSVVAERLYSRGDTPAEIGALLGCDHYAVVAHARGLNLDIALSKDTDRGLALLINRGLHDLTPHSVDAKTTLEAIKLRATIDGKVVQHVRVDRPSTFIIVGDSPEPGVVQGRAVAAIDEAAAVPLDVPGSEETLQIAPAATDAARKDSE